MTDARFPDRWLNDRRIMSLSPTGFRSFIAALSWSVSNMTDGIICRSDILFMPKLFAETSIPELTKNNLLRVKSSTEWELVDFAESQSSKAELEAYFKKKAYDRRYQAQKRAEKAAQKAGETSAQSSGSYDESYESSRQGKARTGKDRQGLVSNPVSVVDPDTGEVRSGWPEERAGRAEELPPEQLDPEWVRMNQEAF